MLSQVGIGAETGSCRAPPPTRWTLAFSTPEPRCPF